mgnify:CR=1 FL=1
MTRNKKIVLLVVLGLAGWMYYNHVQYEAYMRTPEGMDDTARRESRRLYSSEVMSETGRRFFGGYDCLGNCDGHKAGHEWAEQFEVTREYCFSLDAPRSFREGCAAQADDQQQARDDYEGERNEAMAGGEGRW